MKNWKIFGIDPDSFSISLDNILEVVYRKKEPDEIDGEKLIQSKNQIMSQLLSVAGKPDTIEALEQKIKLKEELEQIFDLSKEMTKEEKLMRAIFQTPIYGMSSEAHFFSNSEYMQILLEDIEELRNNGVSEEDIEEVIRKYNLQDEIEVQKRKNQIIQLDRQDFIEYISSMESYNELMDEEFKTDILFKRGLLNKLFGENNLNSYNNEVYDIMKSYAMLKESHPEMEIDELDVSIINSSFDTYLVIVFSNEDGVVSAVAKPKNFETEEMKELQVTRDSEQNYEIQIQYDDESEGDTIEVIKTDKCIENCTYTRINGENIEEAEEVGVTKQPSRKKQIEERIKICEERYNRLKNLQAPPVILEKEEEILEKLRREYLQITIGIEQRRKRDILLADTIKLTESNVGKFNAVEGIAQNIKNTEKEKNPEEQL